MKRVVGDNATLPCHHQFWVGDDPTLDIEWLFLKRVVSICLPKNLIYFIRCNMFKQVSAADIQYKITEDGGIAPKKSNSPKTINH